MTSSFTDIQSLLYHIAIDEHKMMTACNRLPTPDAIVSLASENEEAREILENIAQTMSEVNSLLVSTGYLCSGLPDGTTPEIPENATLTTLGDVLASSRAAYLAPFDIESASAGRPAVLPAISHASAFLPATIARLTTHDGTEQPVAGLAEGATFSDPAVLDHVLNAALGAAADPLALRSYANELRARRRAARHQRKRGNDVESKGRRMKFVVEPKLVGFLAPVPRPARGVTLAATLFPSMMVSMNGDNNEQN